MLEGSVHSFNPVTVTYGLDGHGRRGPQGLANDDGRQIRRLKATRDATLTPRYGRGPAEQARTPSANGATQDRSDALVTPATMRSSHLDHAAGAASGWTYFGRPGGIRVRSSRPWLLRPR